MSERETRPYRVPDDPSGIEQPHDILAADEFGIGTRDERMPPDPFGTGAPHDILAAEEFAMPAGIEPHESGATSSSRLLPLVLIAAVLGYLVLRRRGRGV